MLNHFKEWQLAKRGQRDPRHERFTVYRRARLLLEEYLARNRVCWYAVGAADFARARGVAELLEAEKLFLEAVRQSRADNKPWDVATALYELGLVCHIQGRLVEATDYFMAALCEMCDSLQLDDIQVALFSDAYFQLGILYSRQAQPARARACFDRSMDIDRKNRKGGSLRLTEEALETLGLTSTAPIALDSLIPPPETVTTPTEQEATESYFAQRFQDEPSNLRPATVWILSWSEEAGARFQQAVVAEIAKTPIDHAVCRASLQGDYHPADRLVAKDPWHPLAAVVLVLENEGFHDDRYLDWLTWATRRVAESPDFRLFVGAGSTEKLLEFQPPPEISDRAHREWSDLTNTVQVNADGTPAGVAGSLLRFLAQVPYLRSRHDWRNLVLGFAEAAYYSTMVLEVGAFALVACAFLALAAFNADIPAGAARAALAGGFGISVAPILVVFAYFALRGMAGFELARQQPPIIGVAVVVYLALATWVWDRLVLPGEWFLFGLATGVLAEELRRSSRQLLRRRARLADIMDSIKESPIDIDAAIEAGGVMTASLCQPLISPTFPRIFISYARRLPWSEGAARSLYQSLVGQRGVAYFDVNTISDGSHWRSVLNDCLTDCDVFVGLVERETYTREWVATEWVTALSARLDYGLPEIILLRNAPDGEPPLTPSDLPIPVMARLAHHADTETNENRFRILTLGRTRIQALAAYLGPYRYAIESVVPASVSRLAAVVLLPIVGGGPIGSIVGIPAGLLWFLETERVTNVGAVLKSWALLGAIVLLLAYWAGFTARLSVFSGYEMRMTRRRTIAVLHALIALGLFGLASTWLNDLAPIMIAWSFLACVVGWNFASQFMYVVRNEKIDFR